MDHRPVVIVHGTQRFRDRVPGVPAGPKDRSTTLLGSWYATMLRWRPLVALFINECSLLPMLVPLAPARTVLERIPDAVADLLAAHHVPREVIDGEVTEMAALRVAPTANRSVVGIMNEFGFLADALSDDGVGDLLSLSVRLAATPCGPLYRRHISPDCELAALIAQHAGG